jgi:hypothetical protein
MDHYPENPLPENRLLSIAFSAYRTQFKQILIPQLLLVCCSFILVQFSPFDLSVFAIRKLSTPIMALLLVFSLLHSSFQKKSLQKLSLLHNFDDRAREHQRIYQLRLYWFLFSAFTSCCLFIVAHHLLFFYFAIFDTLLLVMNYPNKQVFKKELMEDDIIFY